MENHHHCKICGNMISPSSEICIDCEKQQKHLPKFGKIQLSSALEEDIEEAIEKWIEKKAREAIDDGLKKIAREKSSVNRS